AADAQLDAGLGAFADASAPDAAASVPDAGAAPEASASPNNDAAADYGAVATATRLARPARLVAATVSVIPRQELDLSPNLTTDAVLRSVPSVATFRRSTSLAADPSAQGLNLRGVGPSGVSRSLVLLDGVPANDPFAGSIYWRSLPRLGLDRAEIVPGGGSALYGSSALSGVVQLFSRDPRVRAFEGDLSYGSLNTWWLNARAAGGNDVVAGALEGEWLRSDGYEVVAPDQRGPIDDNARSQHGSARGTLEVRPTKRLKLAAGGSYFLEKLWNSTRYTSAGAQLATASLRASYDARHRGSVDALWFGRLSRFDQERARVAPERVSESLAARQRVPAGDTGLSLTWASRELGDQLGHRALVGVDGRFVDGTSHERLYPPEPSDESVRERSAGGRQVLVGAFAQDLWRIRSYLQLEGALRADFVQDFSGQVVRVRFSDAQDTQRYPDDFSWAISPRLGLLLEPLPDFQIRASAYRSFRAPTLNELYRSFQVGTIVTAANPELSPETLNGGELGLSYQAWSTLVLRATGFFNLLDDPIVNATLATPLADGSARQRKNLGRARVAGIEAGAELRLWSRLSLLLAYTYADSRVTKEGPVDGLRGKRLAQDPLHRASALLIFDEPAWFSASLQVRYLGAQYEDDLNTLRMPGYALVDLLLARRLYWKLELYGAIENLFNTEYLVGRAGVDTIGAPFMARVGLRIREPRSKR
ncbi:MAG TPA: TonB-dependent receptor, partial [Polyangiales bacterium]